MHQVNNNTDTLQKKFKTKDPQLLDKVVDDADLNPTQKRYFNSAKYENDRKKNGERVGYPTVGEMKKGKCYAGALLPYRTGYKKLTTGIEKGQVLEASRAAPWPFNPTARCPPLRVCTPHASSNL